MSEIPSVSILTARVARLLTEELGRPIKYPALMYLINSGQIPAPPKDESDTFRWLPEHIDAARAILKARRPRIKSQQPK